MKKKETKDVIIDNAVRLFYSKGYTDTSIIDIARSCRITAAAIYHHVKNKEELLWLVYQQLISDLNVLIIDEVNKAKSPEDQLVTFIRCVTNLWITRPELALLQPHPLQSLSTKRRKEYDLSRERWVAFIRGIVEQLKVADRNDLDVNFATFTLANTFSSQTSILTEQGKAYRPKNTKETDELIDTVTKFYFQAILGRPYRK